jgi:hypothetical protein
MRTVKTGQRVCGLFASGRSRFDFDGFPARVLPPLTAGTTLGAKRDTQDQRNQRKHAANAG